MSYCQVYVYWQCVMLMCVLSVCQSQSAKTLHLGTHRPSAQQLTPWRTDRAVYEPAGNVCVWLEERKSDWEFSQVCEGCMCEYVWGLAAKVALWNCHVMLFLLPSLNISLAEYQRVQNKVSKKGPFVCLGSCGSLIELWLLLAWHAKAQNQGEGWDGAQEILSFSSKPLVKQNKTKNARSWCSYKQRWCGCRTLDRVPRTNSFSDLSLTWAYRDQFPVICMVYSTCMGYLL